MVVFGGYFIMFVYFLLLLLGLFAWCLLPFWFVCWLLVLGGFDLLAGFVVNWCFGSYMLTD